MSKFVLDSSALLAALYREPGCASLPAGAKSLMISSPSFGEVVFHATSRGAPLEAAVAVIDRLGIEVHPVDSAQAVAVAGMRSRSATESVPDDAWYALALARHLNCGVVTADPRVRGLEVGVTIECLR